MTPDPVKGENLVTTEGHISHLTSPKSESASATKQVASMVAAQPACATDIHV